MKDRLAKRFDIKDMGKLHHFLGMKVKQDETTGRVWIGQPGYTVKLLKRFRMDQAKPIATPVDSSNKLVKAMEEDEPFDQQYCQSAVAGLYYTSLLLPDLTSHLL